MSAATVFGANIEILTYKNDYFDPDVKKNALLHLWSLGVEEQFYIVWPFLISIVVKFFHKNGLYVLLGFVAISFIFNIKSVYSDPKFAFYFPLCRFWQMAVGGIIAFQKLAIRNKYITNSLSALGVIAISIAIWYIDEKSLFPGFWALVPTLSSAFIIQAGA